MELKTKSEKFLDDKNKLKQKSFENEKKNELLLLNAPQEDLSILETIGLDLALNRAKTEKSEIDALKGLENAYGGKTYLAKDIKKLCIKYDLQIRRADRYPGGVNVEMAKAIKKFSENEKHHVNLGLNYFFVLAPREDFKNHSTNNSFSIFYRESNDGNIITEENSLISVYSCGKDYSEWRQLRFLINRTEFGISIILFSLLSIIMSIIFIIFDQTLAIFITNSIIWIVLFINAIIAKSEKEFKFEKLWNRTEKEIEYGY